MITAGQKRVAHRVVICLMALTLSAGSALGDGLSGVGLADTPVAGSTSLSLGYSPALQAPPDEESPGYDIWTTKRLSGDWGGVRTDLEDKGVSLSMILTTSYSQNFRGGLETHNSNAFSGDWRMNLTLDFDKMGIIPDAWFFIRGKSSWNNGVNPDVGSLGPIHWVFGSGGDEEYYIDKWWYGQRFLEDTHEFRVGKLLTPADLFDIALYAKWPWDHFMNANLNRSPSVPHRKSLGAYMKVTFCSWAQFGMAALDADQTDSTLPADVERAFHDEANFVGMWELNITPQVEGPNGKLPGNYRFGWWYDGRSKRVLRNELGGLLAPRWRNDDVGFYLTFDQLAWKENDDPEDKQGLAVFTRYAYAHPETNHINHFWSVGAQYQGLIPERDKDVLAFGIAQSIMSTKLREEIDPRADRETIYELYYAYHLTPWCIVSPDLQFITNPGGSKDARDSIVVGIRVRMEL